MLHKPETLPIYWDEKQIGIIRRAHVENMQENFVPGVPPLEIAARVGREQTIYITRWKSKDVEWEDVFKFLKVKLFKLFNIKSSVDKLFVKKDEEKKDLIPDDWFDEYFNK